MSPITTRLWKNEPSLTIGQLANAISPGDIHFPFHPPGLVLEEDRSPRMVNLQRGHLLHPKTPQNCVTHRRNYVTAALPLSRQTPELQSLLTKCDLLGIERGGEREKHKTDIIFYPATSTASTHPVAAQAYIRRSDERGITQPGLRFSEYAHESFRFWGGLQNGFAIPGTRGGGHHATWSKIF